MLPINGSLVIWLLLMTVGVRHMSTCTCVYFCLYVYKHYFSFIQPNDIYSTLNGHYSTLWWSLYWVWKRFGTNWRPSLSAFIFVYKGLMTKNVYRDEIKWALAAWKAITCVWVSYCVHCECVSTIITVFVRLCLHPREKELIRSCWNCQCGGSFSPLREQRSKCNVMCWRVFQSKGSHQFFLKCLWASQDKFQFHCFLFYKIY